MTSKYPEWNLFEQGTASTVPDSALTLEKLREAAELIKALPPDPVDEYIRNNGGNPDKGHRLFVPTKMLLQFDILRGHPLVRESPLLSYPVIVDESLSLLRKITD